MSYFWFTLESKRNFISLRSTPPHPHPPLKSEKTRAAAWSWNNFGSSERDGRKCNTILGLVHYEYRGFIWRLLSNGNPWGLALYGLGLVGLLTRETRRAWDLARPEGYLPEQAQQLQMGWSNVYLLADEDRRPADKEKSYYGSHLKRCKNSSVWSCLFMMLARLAMNSCRK